MRAGVNFFDWWWHDSDRRMRFFGGGGKDLKRSVMMKAFKRVITKSVALVAAICTVASVSGFSDDVYLSLAKKAVTPTGESMPVTDVSQSVSVVTQDDIAVSDVHSATDILGTLPGVFVEKTGELGRSDVSIRGEGNSGRYISVMIDGRPEKSSIFDCSVSQTFPLNNVDRIEVIRGPASVMYGSDAFGGVVNILTRKAQEKFEGDAMVSYGSFNTQEYRVRQGNNLGPWNYYFTIDKQSTDGYIDNTAYNGQDQTLRVGYTFQDKSELSLSSKYYFCHDEMPNPKISNYWEDYKRGSVDLNYAKKNDDWNGFIKAYRNFGQHLFADGWNSRDYTDGAIAHGSIKLVDSNELGGGLEFKNADGNVLGGVPKPGEYKMYDYAGYLNDSQTFFQKLTVNAGARYNVDEISGASCDPQAGAVYKVVDGTALRANISNGFRDPDMFQLYLEPFSNQNLKPEQVWNYEFGINQKVTDKVNVDIVGYVMDGTNLIQMAGTYPAIQFQNIGTFEFKGIEASLSACLWKYITGQLNYSYLNPGQYTADTAGRKADISVRYDRNKVSGIISGQYVGDYYENNNSAGKVDDFFIVNAKISYKFTKHLSAFLAVNNIGDKSYGLYNARLSELVVQPGRYYNSGINYAF